MNRIAIPFAVGYLKCDQALEINMIFCPFVFYAMFCQLVLLEHSFVVCYPVYLLVVFSFDGL